MDLVILKIVPPTSRKIRSLLVSRCPRNSSLDLLSLSSVICHIIICHPVTLSSCHLSSCHPVILSSVIFLLLSLLLTLGQKWISLSVIIQVSQTLHCKSGFLIVCEHLKQKLKLTDFNLVTTTVIQSSLRLTLLTNSLRRI